MHTASEKHTYEGDRAAEAIRHALTLDVHERVKSLERAADEFERAGWQVDASITREIYAAIRGNPRTGVMRAERVLARIDHRTRLRTALGALWEAATAVRDTEGPDEVREAAEAAHTANVEHALARVVAEVRA